MIETKRLIVRPLTLAQLDKYVLADNSLEEELGLIPASRKIPDELRDALRQTIIPHVADKSKDYLYSTIWTIIAKDRNKMVGDLCFIGEPDELGQVEIGYGIYEEYRKNGFMTEAVEGMIHWAERQDKVKTIIAQTDKSNIDSFAVLEKNNFKKTEESRDMFKWELNLNAV